MILFQLKKKKLLAIEAAKLVLPIWEVYYKDDRPHLAIQAAEEYLDNPTGENIKKVREAVIVAYNVAINVGITNATAYAAYYVTYAAAYAANNIAAYYAAASAACAAASAYSAAYVDAVYNTIEATKEFFKIEEKCV